MAGHWVCAGAAVVGRRSVDIGRSGPAHLTFGHGARYCLGAPLARIELHTVFSQLVTRLPTLHLAVDPAELTLRRDVLTGGLTALPVRGDRFLTD